MNTYNFSEYKADTIIEEFKKISLAYNNPLTIDQFIKTLLN